MWLNALSDGSAINSQARNIYVGALAKPYIACSRTTTSSGSLSSVLAFKRFHGNNRGCCKVYQPVLRTYGVSPSIAQNRALGSTITGTLSFHGAFSKCMLGVIKWNANGCLPFTTSRSAGNEVKKRGGIKLTSRNKKHSGVNTSKKCQTEQQQFKESPKNTKASLTHSPANGHVDVAERKKPMKTKSTCNSKIENAKHSSPKNNKGSSRTVITREVNVQEPVNNSTELFTTSGSAGIEVKKSGGMKLNSRKKHSGLNISKKCETEQRQIQESSKTTKAGSKDSPANGHVDVAETNNSLKTQSAFKSMIAKGKPSSPKNNKGRSTVLSKREVQDPINSSMEPFTTSGSAGNEVKESGRMNLNSRKKNHSRLNISMKYQTELQQIQESSKTTKAISKHSPTNAYVDVAETSEPIKTESSPKFKIAKGKRSLPKNNERQSSTSLKREMNDQGPLNSSKRPITASHKPQAKEIGWSKINESKNTNKNNIMIEKIDKRISAEDADQKSEVAVMKAKTRAPPKVNNEQATKTNIKETKTAKKHSTNVVQKLQQAAAGERTKSGNTKVFGNQGVPLKESRMTRLTKVKKKELPDNVKSVPGKLSEKKAANTSVHSEGKVLVVVESATKAKTIQKYLGDAFVVLASYGHVRDLAGRAGSVRPEEGFDMVWEVPSTAWQHIRAIEEASTRASSVVLASDPDREGEAIAWHVTEMLKMQGSWKENMLVKRVVFHEITESAIRNAMQTPRDISMDLVNAYLARRALDYLIGFNISPILWRKLPGCQSAGRVQSAALSLICEREKEIEDFVSQEYWTIEAEACNSEWPVPGTNSAVMTMVTHVDGKKLEKFTIKSEAEAMEVVEKVSSSKFKVLNMKRTTKRKTAPLPYITSTLQQDAANKLNFRAFRTMMVAQKLYEGVKISDNEVVGLITYMRTDGLRISEDALKSIHLQVTERYGQAYAVKEVRKFVKKVKNAQEAHEAIRPTDIRRLPSMLADVLEDDALKLYTLIWCQTMACQMSDAEKSQISVSFGNEDGSLLLRSSASAISFPGYLAVFKDNEIQHDKGEDDPEKMEDNKFSFLSQLKVRDPIDMIKAKVLPHLTEPSPRYSEGTLVKKLEELGIGRPSTYAPILKTLEAREYVTIKNRQINPEFRGRMVSAFLSHYFPEIIDYGFTADLESQLDNISAGRAKWKNLLNKFWESFNRDCGRVIKIDVHQVENMLGQTFGDHLFAALPGESRLCPACEDGTLNFKVSRHGAGYFIGCDKYPKCSYIARTMFSEEDKEDKLGPIDTKLFPPPKILGIDPNSNQEIFLKHGPYGCYVQLGVDRKGFTPKRVNASQIKDISSFTLEDAVDMLRYPVLLGKHPADEEPVELRRTKTGFAVRHRHFIAVVPKNVDHQTVTLDIAVQMLKGPGARRTGRPSVAKSKRSQIKAKKLYSTL